MLGDASSPVCQAARRQGGCAQPPHGSSTTLDGDQSFLPVPSGFRSECVRPVEAVGARGEIMGPGTYENAGKISANCNYDPPHYLSPHPSHPSQQQQQQQQRWARMVNAGPPGGLPGTSRSKVAAVGHTAAAGSSINSSHSPCPSLKDIFGFAPRPAATGCCSHTTTRGVCAAQSAQAARARDTEHTAGG
jgi:hypothetical protein